MSENASSLYQEMRIVLVMINAGGIYDERLPRGSDRLPYLVLFPSVEGPKRTLQKDIADLFYHLLCVLRFDFLKVGKGFTPGQ